MLESHEDRASAKSGQTASRPQRNEAQEPESTRLKSVNHAAPGIRTGQRMPVSPSSLPSCRQAYNGAAGDGYTHRFVDLGKDIAIGGSRLQGGSRRHYF